MDESVFSAALQGLAVVFSWPYIVYPVAGTLLAMLFSAAPGLNSSSLMALAIPFTVAWDPTAVMLLFGAFVGGATFMGSITAILFNIPGKAQNAVTLLDGYPLTLKGQARTAIGCAAAASALGSSFGVLVLVALIPLMREAAMLLGPAEFLMLAIWGLSMLAAVTGNSIIKGLLAAGLGLLLALIGIDPRSAGERFTFGLDYLHDGLSLVPILLGLFALAEMLSLVTRWSALPSNPGQRAQAGGSAWAGIRAVLSRPGLLLRSSVIGTVIGAIPGVGSSVAGFVAYAHASQSAGDRSAFGQGDIRGVLAPEAANDAKDGGALIPTLALGIPGGTGTAVLLGVLSLHGMSPGREMLDTNLVLVFVLIWSLFLSNWLTSLLGLALVSPMARLSSIKTRYLVPVILALALASAYYYRGLWQDVVCAVSFGLLGYLMKRYDWPRIPLLIAFALAPLLEANLYLTMRLHELERIDFWSRPLVLLLLLMTVANIALPGTLQGLRRLHSRSRKAL
jgi:putative tricarboxylic transport membrane protein